MTAQAVDGGGIKTVVTEKASTMIRGEKLAISAPQGCMVF